ncbi:hypothetical protein [Vulgatibacter sp.]|uniref:hypothetical protein n=1 Tax=Vulgatibacter sp. TaxID=1971226 RepID=UPI003567874D
MVEVLARRAEVRRLSVQEARDGLVSWFMERAEPQVRRGMKFTSPHANAEEIQRVLQQRARTFFHRLASTWEEPTWADLRRVKTRMQTYLLPQREVLEVLAHEIDLWDFILAGGARPEARA